MYERGRGFSSIDRSLGQPLKCGVSICSPRFHERVQIALLGRDTENTHPQVVMLK